MCSRWQMSAGSSMSILGRRRNSSKLVCSILCCRSSLIPELPAQMCKSHPHNCNTEALPPAVLLRLPTFVALFTGGKIWKHRNCAVITLVLHAAVAIPLSVHWPLWHPCIPAATIDRFGCCCCRYSFSPIKGRVRLELKTCILLRVSTFCCSSMLQAIHQKNSPKFSCRNTLK